MREVSVVKAKSRQVGGCNGCTEHITLDGGIEHVVWEIDLRGVSVRVCKECRAQLIAKLLEA